MLKKLLVLALTSGLAARTAQAWLARRQRSRQQTANGVRTVEHGRWADDGGRVMPPSSPQG